MNLIKKLLRVVYITLIINPSTAMKIASEEDVFLLKLSAAFKCLHQGLILHSKSVDQDPGTHGLLQRHFD